ncbi:thioredoxin domain-containing protein [Phreatobacter sp.]|uniref:thioredoxin domain-containing protein n=1 Tax=Phreatobacter sp. TaxID=1966341 RepID=UPI003F7260E2
MPLSRRLLLAAPAVIAGSGALAQGAWYPLKDRAGREVPNFRVAVEIETDIHALANAIPAGSGQADVILTEIYDANCGYCRRAAADVKAMLAADGSLGLRLINAPSLGLPSFQAARVEYAVKQIGGEARALAFHEASMAARGVFDGLRALDLAKDLGLDDREIEDLADREETGVAIASATRLANAANLSATPSWLMAGVALIGWPGRGVLEGAIAAVRRCDRPVCE